MVMSWVFELTPEGMIRTEDVPITSMKRNNRRGRQPGFYILSIIASGSSVCFSFRPIFSFWLAPLRFQSSHNDAQLVDWGK